MSHCIKWGERNGKVFVPASKSYAHRRLICAALGEERSTLVCRGISKDIAATAKCLSALGAEIEIEENGEISVLPIKKTNSEIKHLYCGESGSTLRFLIPVVGALGETAVFHMEGKLSERPLDALTDELSSHGMTFNKDGAELYCSGKIDAGAYKIPGNISSQYVSGLLFALPTLEGESILEVTGKIESADYIKMTEDVIRSCGIEFSKNENKYTITGTAYKCGDSEVERDWSNAAFFVCMGALSKKGITLEDMPVSSVQGDREILNIVKKFGADVTVCERSITVKKGELRGQIIDASEIPDLVPTLGALAALSRGETRIINAQRLRFKESDRLATTSQMLRALGADVAETEDGLVIEGKESLPGGVADAANDHRIAMAAAVAACGCRGDVFVEGEKCVEKSYPDFWRDLDTLEVTQ